MSIYIISASTGPFIRRLSIEEEAALQVILPPRERIDRHLYLSLVTLMDPPTPPPPLSKSAQKKAVRAARYAELKLERRAKEKEAKKEKRRIRAEKRAAGELDEDDEAEKARKKKKPRIDFGGRVVVDLGFDHLMSEKVSHYPLGWFVSTALHDEACLSRKSNLFVPNSRIPTAQTAMRLSPSLCYLLPLTAGRLIA